MKIPDSEDKFYVVVNDNSKSSIKEILRLAIAVIVALAVGYSFSYFLPFQPSDDIVKLSDRIDLEEKQVLIMHGKYRKKKDKHFSSLNKLALEAKMIKNKDFENRYKNQLKVNKVLKKRISDLSAENIELYGLINLKTRTERDQQRALLNFSKSLARENGKNKLLFGTTIGFGVTTLVLGGVIGALFYLR